MIIIFYIRAESVRVGMVDLGCVFFLINVVKMNERYSTKPIQIKQASIILSYI